MKTTHFFLLFFGSFCFLFSQEPSIFEEENDLVIMEAESTPSQFYGEIDSVFSGYTGEHYLIYKGSNNFNSPSPFRMIYKVQTSKIGTYRIRWRSRIGQGMDHTEHNDSWLRIKDASRFYAQKASSVLYPHGSGMSPNPAEDYLVVSLPPSLLQGDPYKAHIMDVSGRVVKNIHQQTFTGQGGTILLEDISPGIYFLSVKGSSGYYRGSLVKQ